MKGDKLNEQVAIHVKKWTPKIQGYARVTGWYNLKATKDHQYKGIGLPDWARSVCDAFKLLEGHHFELFTCDLGYGCKISTAPEHGEALIAEAYGHILPTVICQAVVKAKLKERIPNAKSES